MFCCNFCCMLLVMWFNFSVTPVPIGLGFGTALRLSLGLRGQDLGLGLGNRNWRTQRLSRYAFSCVFPVLDHMYVTICTYMYVLYQNLSYRIEDIYINIGLYNTTHVFVIFQWHSYSGVEGGFCSSKAQQRSTRISVSKTCFIQKVSLLEVVVPRIITSMGKWWRSWVC